MYGSHSVCRVCMFVSVTALDAIILSFSCRLLKMSVVYASLRTIGRLSVGLIGDSALSTKLHQCFLTQIQMAFEPLASWK